MTRLRLGLIFGGRSVEHEVSLTSARALLGRLDPARYEVVPIGITHEGRWLTATDARALLGEAGGRGGLLESAGRPAALTGDPAVGGLLATRDGAARVALDVVFPLVHGTGGEDGTLQGLLELAGLPYVGAGVLGSSLGMDKWSMKVMFASAGLEMAPYVAVTRREVDAEFDRIASRVASSLSYPCFTKPSNGGSSVGVCKVRGPEELRAALHESAGYDRRILIEKAVEGQEVECAVLGNDDPEASVVGEIVPCNEFYDYRAKYIDEGSELIIPARVSPAQSEKVRQMSLTAFRCLDLAGMARVDFFVRRGDGAVLINEVNTIPGFTPISMYPRLWEASGLPYERLLDRLIDLAIQRHRETSHAARAYDPAAGRQEKQRA